MFPRIANWLNSPEKARKKALAAAEKALGDKKIAKRDKGKYLLTLGGIEAFLAADGQGPKEDVLSKHSFWQRDKPMLGVDAATYVQLLQHSGHA